MPDRISIAEYAIALAHVASLRSEDPFRKVGAVALDHSNRVIGTAYNGLAPGFDAPEGFWDDRDQRQEAQAPRAEGTTRHPPVIRQGAR